jgi:VIT1/CCC1 family predicted Fe2+/Mn2+ transporter
MSNESIKTSKRVLEPYERISEILFGLIMVLTFTGSISVARAGRDDVRTMLIGALGCNMAWGIIDGLLYLMGCLSERGRGIRSWRALRKASSPAEAQRVIADALPPMVAAALGPAEYESIHQRALQWPEPPSRPRLRSSEWLGAVAVALCVILTTFPVAMPFLFMTDVRRAMRLSNLVAVILLFVTGYAFGRVAEHHPLMTGFAMVVVGSVLVALTMALGG